MLSRDRLGPARRAIGCYRRQTYPHRELVIVSQGTARYRAALARCLAEADVPDARIVPADPALRLGALRNLALDAARGALVCVWDDDDCSRPDRLQRQVERLDAGGFDAVFLSSYLHLSEPDRVLRWLDHRNVQDPPEHPLLPGTMLMRRDARFRYRETGRHEHHGEDWALMLDLRERGRVHIADDLALLYLYTFHGGNTFSRDHHERMWRRFSRPSSVVAAHAGELRAALARFPVAPPVDVHGAEGFVFTAKAAR
ncbi:Glycosyl transferase family 2 [Actinomadura rubteroloni]|uniref:Glycosyl transferase family 2 n=2 Tax=Actinomadura rubteroloni TaxID=1926885 RepID=A0A2P4UJS1_9ACTN|nr:Glycosyl transferase family 2 [Actinomadura rubteroloni]